MDAHALEPPRHCNSFNTSATCHKFFTPKGLCEWQPGQESHLLGSPACVSRTDSNCMQVKLDRKRQPRQPPQPPSPPLLVPRPTSPMPLADRLNERFLRGQPSSNLFEAGVLVHMQVESGPTPLDHGSCT